MTLPAARIPVAVLGATGSVGQRFVELLDQHPWFQVVSVTGSDRAIGQRYADACHWILPEPMPEWARDLIVLPSDPELAGVPAAFSALPTSSAHEVEAAFARSGTAVCTNASAYRQEPDVPLVLPEVNPEHTSLIPFQQRNRGWRGFIVANSNCTITGLTVALKPLLDRFGVRKAFAVSMQAVSGAGYPGVASLDILGNVVPFVKDEEDKMETEPLKMLGDVEEERFRYAEFKISAQANRVAVIDGHMVCLSVELGRAAEPEDVLAALKEFEAPAISRDLPSAPPAPIQVRDEPDRPQPRLDIMAGGGMTTVIGRVRPDPILDYKMVILSHNTIRGAAGASIYNAELLAKQGYLSLPG